MSPSDTPTASPEMARWSPPTPPFGSTVTMRSSKVWPPLASRRWRSGTAPDRPHGENVFIAERLVTDNPRICLVLGFSR